MPIHRRAERRRVPTVRSRTSLGELPATRELSAFEILERSAKVVLASVAVLYCAGVLLTNLALMRIGVTEFSSLRAKYVFTGLWPFVLVLIASLPWIYRALAMADHHSGSHSDKTTVRKATVNGFIAGLTVYFLFCCVFLGLGWIEALVAAVPMFIFAYPIVFGVRDALIEPMSSRVRTLFVVVAFLLAVGVGFWSMSSEAYFEIPQQLGGGKPLKAKLVLTKEGQEFWAQVVDKSYKGPALSGDVEVFYETDKELLIKTMSDNAEVNGGRKYLPTTLRIDKALVQAVVESRVTPSAEILLDRLVEKHDFVMKHLPFWHVSVPVRTAIELDNRLFIDSCTQKRLVVRCSVHVPDANAGASSSTALFEGHRLSGTALRFDASKSIEIPGTLVNAPDMMPGGHGNLEIQIPDETAAVLLRYK